MTGTGFDRELARGSAELLRTKRLELSALEIPAGRGWHPLRDKVTEVLDGHPQSIGAVVAKLVALQAVLDELPPSPAKNRVSAFNELYLKITRRVELAILTGVNEPEFLELLDIEFAKRYFDALGLWNNDDEDTPDVWEVLFKRAGDTKMSRLIAAMLGVNAHINHDLALALIATWNETGAPLDDAIHPDYLLVNEIFYEEIPPLRRGFSTKWQLELDEFVGGLDDWSQRVLVTVTRARAWDQARDLWELRHDGDDFEQARRTMDRAASLLAEWVIIGDRIVNGAGGGWRRLRRRFAA
ncbi:DUF5995 family protein [Paractinoplanes brasiliensis]|uniref:Uncharacterized protein n=1 Tax=Paractinoplanes brasiliensis TaxID=52695 RepID=A0A4R6JBH9_9ACTN|nr:DUF5995 family protein [Actinoplanes brasiliensis]TDO31865.1 hypothetical protein C8E87_7300 [Actinoplanes brasiliensis]GID27909.1 hypothetical protein Abr02nite_28920 [Actinoplanes brasiliensis]